MPFRIRKPVDLAAFIREAYSFHFAPVYRHTEVFYEIATSETPFSPGFFSCKQRNVF